MEPIHLDPSVAAAVTTVNVRPLVLFTILDHHVRRDPSQEEAIGALLGTVSGGVVEITDAFGVYHKRERTEDGEERLQVSRSTLTESLELRRKASPKQVFVGWYRTWANATAPPATHVDGFTMKLQDYFFADAVPAAAAGGLARPLHLVVDVSIRVPRINVYGYRQVMNSLTKAYLNQFAGLKVSVTASAEERVALDSIARASHLREAREAPMGRTLGGGPGELRLDPLAHPLGEYRDLPSESHGLETSLRRLRKLLETAERYVGEVVAGTREGDEAVGRAIADALASVPPVDAEAFERTYGRASNDLLMVAYLASLMQAQLRLAERITVLPTTY